MKEVKWEECIFPGASGTYPPPSGKMRYGDGPVQVGMHVAAKYSDLDIHLRIQDAKDQQNLIAEVLFFEPVLTDTPEDLAQGDIVSIAREHICWLYDD